MKNFSLHILLFLLPLVGYSQIKISTGTLNELRKSANKNKTFESYSKLAEAFFLIQKFDSAYKYFNEASVINNNPQIAIKKAKCNISLNKISQAVEDLNPYKEDKNVAHEISFIKNTAVKYKYNIEIVKDLCSDANEFVTSINKNEMFITSDKVLNELNLANDPITGNPPFALYKAYINYTSANRNYSSLNSFSNKINQRGSVGAANYCAISEMVYFTKTVRSKKDKSLNLTQIFAVSKNSKPVSFKYNSELYSVQHPALSVDGRVLIFSSDMPGGYGKFDLYKCELGDDNSWSEPKNLGEYINTAENEVFPFISKNGHLYFSSNGLPGYGGLDLFLYSSIIAQNTYPENLGSNINSIFDDFGYCTGDSLSNGYFNSNRPANEFKGDNIFFFRKLKNTKEMKGRISNSISLQNGNVSGLRLILLNKRGEIVARGSTDKDGFFMFSELEIEENYLLKIDTDDPQLIKQKYYLFTEDEKLVSTTVINQNGEAFFFQTLPTDLTLLDELSLEDEKLNNFSAIVLKADKNGKKTPVINKKVILFDGKGNFIRYTTTNTFGSFVFTQINPLKSFVVMLEEDDAGINKKAKYFIVNSRGEILSTNNKVEYKNVYFNLDSLTFMSKQNQIETNSIKKTLKGVLKGINEDHGVPEQLEGVFVSIVDGSGKVIKTVITNAKGAFEFIGLAFDSTYYLSVKNDDPGLKKYKLFRLENEAGNKVLEMKREKLTSFGYKILKADEEKIALYYYEDPWLNVISKSNTKKELVITENILYETNSSEISENAKIVLDKIIVVLKQNTTIKLEVGAHTDSRASNDFNLKLSQKRAQRVVDYLVEHGIDGKKLVAVGYGESKLKNKCTDGVVCSEDEHAENRRTEFTVFNK